MKFPDKGHRPALLVLPLCFVIVALILRQHSGPFWLWSNLDPDYWYLFDALNIVNLNWPQHIAHPGTTVQTLGAVLIRIMHPLSDTGEITRLVLTNPERYLSLIGQVLIAINGVALLLAGMAVYKAFGSLTGALFVQLGPFLSKLIFKHVLHVSPEPLLVTTVLALAAVLVLATRPGEMDRRPLHYAVAFAIIAGFGLATKVTSAGIYLMPVFLLAKPRALVTYGATAVLFTLVFTLPAAGSYGKIVDWITIIATGSGPFGTGQQTFIDLAAYPRNLLKVSSRPIFFIVLFTGIGLLMAARRRGHEFSPTVRALAGLCLAFLAQALLVAKHPSGHYMIPAFTLGGLGIALIYQTWLELATSGGTSGARVRTGFAVLLAALIIAQSSAMIRLDRHFMERAGYAATIDEAPYSACARIYFWPASSLYYALFMGSYMTGQTFSAVLQKLYPDKSILIAAPDGTITSWNGDRQARDIAKNYPCVFARGERVQYVEDPRPRYILPFATEAFAAYKIKGVCQKENEAVFTWGMDCKGNK